MPTEKESDINLNPEEGMRVFKKTERAPEGQFVANTVVEFPIDPRVWLAGMAMHAIMTSIHFTTTNPAFASKEAVKYADELLKALDNKS